MVLLTTLLLALGLAVGDGADDIMTRHTAPLPGSEMTHERLEADATNGDSGDHNLLVSGAVAPNRLCGDQGAGPFGPAATAGNFGADLSAAAAQQIS